jgi:hypothetical protein
MFGGFSAATHTPAIRSRAERERTGELRSDGQEQTVKVTPPTADVKA